MSPRTHWEQSAWLVQAGEQQLWIQETPHLLSREQITDHFLY